jgi:phage shock protein PspC (stress-responsive transcriptional regulator)
MIKTVNINISGLVFHINEDAYEKLSKYLKNISNSFSIEEGREEIMADIEARIAEIFRQKLNERKEVLSMTDVDEVISIMGQPEQYTDFASGEAKSSHTQNINLPKRIFRDPDDKILGGVCSGISTYFGIEDPIWLRILFVVMFFVFGSGPLIYIILWIIIPKASSATEKLQMKGEPINIDNISKTIQEEMEDIKKKVQGVADNKTPIDTSKFAGKVKSTIIRTGELLLSLLMLLVNAFVKFFSFIILIVAVAILITLFAALIGDNFTWSITRDGVTSMQTSDILNWFFISQQQAWWAKLSLFILVAVPLIGIMLGASKILLGIKKKLRFIGGTLTIIWVAALIFAFYTATMLSREYRVKGSHSNSIEIQQPLGDLHLMSDYYPEKELKIVMNTYSFFMLSDEDHIVLGYPKINISKSESGLAEIEITSFSRGDEKKTAIEKSKRISYNYTQSEDTLSFQPFYKIPVEDKFRMQDIYINVKLPQGKRVVIDSSMKHLLHDVENLENIYDRNMVGKIWVMTEKGLSCVDCIN